MQNTDRHREWERENVREGGGTRAAFAVGHGACCVYVFSLNFYLFGSRSYFPVCPLSPLPPGFPSLSVETSVLPSNSLGVISLFQCFTLLNYKWAYADDDDDDAARLLLFMASHVCRPPPTLSPSIMPLLTVCVCVRVVTSSCFVLNIFSVAPSSVPFFPPSPRHFIQMSLGGVGVNVSSLCGAKCFQWATQPRPHPPVCPCRSAAVARSQLINIW